MTWQERRLAKGVIVLTAPFNVLGVAMTLSVFGAFFGIPLLVLCLPEAVWAASWLRAKGSDGMPRHLPMWFGAFAAVLTVASLGALVSGADDLDGFDIPALLIPVTWIVASWVVVARLWTARSAQSR